MNEQLHIDQIISDARKKGLDVKNKNLHIKTKIRILKLHRCFEEHLNSTGLKLSRGQLLIYGSETYYMVNKYFQLRSKCNGKIKEFYAEQM